MRDAWILFVALARNNGTFAIEGKHGKLWTRLLWVFLALCFLPVLGLWFYNFYTAFGLHVFDQTLLEGGLFSGTLMLAVLGFLVLPSVLFYARDLPVLLPLPITSDSLILAKMLNASLYEILFFLCIRFPVLGAWLWAGNLSLLNVLLVLLVIVAELILVLPLLGTLVILLMKGLGKFLSRDRFLLFASLLAVAFVVWMGLSTGTDMAPASVEELAALQYSAGILVTIPWMANVLLHHDWMSLLFLVCAAVLSCLLFRAVARKWYLETAMASLSVPSRSISIRTRREQTPFFSLMAKENRMLLRTPSWFLNCILSGLIGSVILVVLLVVQPETLSFVTSLSPGFVHGLGAGLVVSLLFGSLNMICATTFSREGQNLWWMHSIPTSLHTQILAKGAVGLVWCLLDCLIPFAILVWLFPTAVLFLSGALCAIVTGSLFACWTGLAIDAWHPKLNWTDEQAAVKQNLNAVLSMLAAWIVLALFAGLAFLVSVDLACALAFVLVVVLDVLFWYRVPPFAISCLKNKI